MSYTIKQIAKLTGISVRTLHHYDQIGLLTPKRNSKNEYREYSEPDLIILQQILFFKEIDLPLEQIEKIIKNPNFDNTIALKDHKRLITLKKERLEKLLHTIDKTINTLNKNKPMNNDELFSSFSLQQIEKYTNEAKEKWGHTEAFKQSQKRVGKMSKSEIKKISDEQIELAQNIAEYMKSKLSTESIKTQKLIEKHYNQLRYFYEPTKEIYKGLADIYVSDPRFKLYFENISLGLAQYMHDAMIFFINKNLINRKL